MVGFAIRKTLQHKGIFEKMALSIPPFINPYPSITELVWVLEA